MPVSVELVEMLLKDGEALYVLKRTEARFEEIVCRLVSLIARACFSARGEHTLGAMIGLSDSRDMRGILNDGLGGIKGVGARA